MAYTDLDELRSDIEDNGDLLALEMWEVRDAYGADRLGRIVRQNIAKELHGRGLASFPRELPDRQGEVVRVYKVGTPVAELIEAVLSPSDDGDDRLRDAAAGEASKQLQEIRETVCG